MSLSGFKKLIKEEMSFLNLLFQTMELPSKISPKTTPPSPSNKSKLHHPQSPNPSDHSDYSDYSDSSDYSDHSDYSDSSDYSDPSDPSDHSDPIPLDSTKNYRLVPICQYLPLDMLRHGPREHNLL